MRRHSIILLLASLFAFASVGCDDDGGTKTPDSGTPDSGTPDSGNPDSGTPDSGEPDSGTPTRTACPQGNDSSPSRSCYLATPTADCFNTAANASAAYDKYYLNRCAPTKTCSPVSVTIPSSTWTPGTPLPQPK